MTETRETTEKKVENNKTKSGKQERSLPVRILRWFVIHFFKVVESIIRLFGIIYYGIKTMVVLLFHSLVWPYPIFFRRHK